MDKYLNEDAITAEIMSYNREARSLKASAMNCFTLYECQYSWQFVFP